MQDDAKEGMQMPLHMPLTRILDEVPCGIGNSRSVAGCLVDARCGGEPLGDIDPSSQ